MTGDGRALSKQPAIGGSGSQLQSLVGREVIVPAAKVGLEHDEEPLQGTVVLVSQEEPNCLWCTFPGNSKWYCWHVDEVQPWLVQPWHTAVKHVLPLSDRKIAKQARKTQQNSSSGRARAGMTGKPTRTRPQPPGSEHLWKYCKRCNSWKQRPNDFSKNNRTPDGLQFYCRFCHNRMTKFNQARRLEDQHVAQKQMLLANSPEHHSYKPQASRQLAKLGASISVAQHKQQARFDVLGSKVPRQPRTLAMYRKESAADILSGDLPDNGCDGNDQHQHTSDDMNHSAGQGDKVKQPHPHAALKQHSPRVKALPKPALRCQSNPAELMLQANLVLEQLEKVQAQADHRSQGPEHHAVSSHGPPLQHSGRRASSCSQQQRGSPAKPSEVCDSPDCLAVPQQDKLILQEPTSSSTSYVQISMPDSPPAAAAAQTSASAQQPIKADKAAVGQITLTGPLPVQPQPTQHDKAAVTANGESAHRKLATAAAELREADARSSSAVQLESTRSPVFGAAWQGSASQASEQRPRSHASGAHTSANADCPTAPSAAASPLAAAQSNEAADLMKNICELSPSPEVSSSKSGARLASMSLPSSGSSRKRQRSTASPNQRPADSSGMDPLAAAAAAVEADDKEDPSACGGQAETEGRGNPAQTQQELSMDSRTERLLPRPTTEQAPALSPTTALAVHSHVPPAMPLATAPAAVAHASAAAGDSLSTLASLMTAMPPEQLQEVLKGLRVSGSSMVPAQVLETMSKQLEEAMAPSNLSTQATNNLSAQDPGVMQRPGLAPSTHASGPAPMSTAAKSAARLRRVHKAKTGTTHSTAGMLGLPAPGTALHALGRAGDALLDNQPIPSLPSTAVITTATAPLAPLGNTALPISNAFSWLHAQGQQQPAPGSAPAILGSLAGSGNTQRRTYGMGPVFGTAQERTPAAGAFPAAALGTASSLGYSSASAAGSAAALGSAHNLGAGNALGAVLGTAPAQAALELTLLLTTLQSLAVGSSQTDASQTSQTTLATNCHGAMAQLRDWLSQLQRQVLPSPEPSQAQQAQEDAVLAGQVRSEMWGNLQCILNMLTSQGCSHQVRDMVHQIAVHFANEQSHSVAVDRRLRNSLTKEKDARRRMQQQLQGCVQVLTALQRVLGSVKMQQQHQQLSDKSRSPSCQQLQQGPIGVHASGAHHTASGEWEQYVVQQQEWRRKETAFQAELSLAQTNNAKLHEQLSLLKAAALQDDRRSGSPGQQLRKVQADKQTLADDLSACKAQRDWLHEQLDGKSANNRQLAEENNKLMTELKALRARAGPVYKSLA